MNSTQFDSFLVLLNSPLQLPEIAIDDDSGGGTDSLIAIDLDAGTYIILANSALVSPETGAYTLTTTFGPAWVPTSLTLAPDARTQHTAVWTGTEMIVWGGHDATTSKNTGARFNPATNTWTPIATAGAPSARILHTAVWTGTDMIIWGGWVWGGGPSLNDGARYNPLTDTWTPITAVNQPSARVGHTAVWTGTEMVVWGGLSCLACVNSQLNTGARYNPVTDMWTSTATTGAPSGRAYHTAIWTGSQMIVWGGNNDAAPGPPVVFNSGGVYNLATNSWTATTLVNTPPPTKGHSAVWTGTDMIVYGGQTDPNLSCGGYCDTNTGSRYNPATDSWNPISPAPLNYSTSSATASTTPTVWSGTQMITCCEDGGARYNPLTDSWNRISPSDKPTIGVRGHSLVWTGASMIAWGGDNGGAVFYNTGGIYDPSSDSTP